MSGTRSFVAFGLSAEVRRRLGEARLELVTQAPSWRNEKWVAENNLHVTLKFLGNLSDTALADIRVELGTSLAGSRSFEIQAAGLRAVPGARRCSMVWATFDDPEKRCAALAARVESAALVAGIDADGRPFTPHVTLVRSRRPHRLADEALTSANGVTRTPPISMSVLSVTLFASTLTRTGPVYETIDEWDLLKPETGRAK